MAESPSPFHSFFMLGLAGVLLVGATGLWAQDRVGLSLVLDTGPFHVAGRWTPVRVDATNSTDQSLQAVIVLPVADPSISVEMRLPVHLPAYSRSWFTLYAAFPETPSLPREAREKSIISVAEIRSETGARLGRGELLGRPETASGQTDAGLRLGLMLLCSGREDDAGEGYDVSALSNALSQEQVYRLTPATIPLARLPRLWAGYDAARYVVLDGLDVELLDQAQRQALLQHVLRGGVLILPQPQDFTGTWIEPYMPVHYAGERLARQVGEGAGHPLRLINRLKLVEALEGSGTVLLADAHYVHAAYRQVGLGRVVFTSFPLGGLDWRDSKAIHFMEELLDLRPMPADWSATLLAERGEQVMESMLGMPTSPWSVAAAVAGGYVAMVLLIQLLAPGARRPVGFAATLLLASVVTGVFLVLTIVRRAESPLVGASLMTVDLGRAEGGIAQELVAFFGRSDAGLSVTGASQQVVLKAVKAIGPSPWVQQQPFAAPQAGVSAGRVERIWMAQAPVPTDQHLSIIGRFGPQGLVLQADNRLDQTLQAPLLIWEGRLIRLGDIPLGSIAMDAGEVNRPGDWTNVTVLAGELARLRGLILEMAQARPADRLSTLPAQPPLLAGWIDGSSSSGLIQTSTKPDVWRRQVLVRVPVEVVPSEPGVEVQIRPEYSRLLVVGAGLPYDPSKQEWIPSMQSGRWILGFAAPQQVGRIHPQRVTVRADINAPRHIIRLQRGVVHGDAPRDSISAADLVVWQGVTGIRQVSFEPTVEDFDSQGRIWLQLVVDPIDTGMAQVMPHWSFRSISAGIEGRVIGSESE